MVRLDARRGAAGGPTEWTSEHILAATKFSAQALNAALACISLVLTGELPRHDSLLNACLMGLQKPDGGVRPIAVGEAWYRLAGLCARTTCEKKGPSLAPIQLRVGITGGVESIGHAIRSALLTNHDVVLMAVDLENAFNSVKPPALFAVVNE